MEVFLVSCPEITCLFVAIKMGRREGVRVGLAFGRGISESIFNRPAAARPFSSQTLRAAVAEIHFTIKRSRHGVNYGLPAWGDDVALTVAVEGICK